MDANDMKMPDALRITAKRWRVPARTFAQRAIRDAQAAAADAEKSVKSSRKGRLLCDIALMHMEQADENLAEETRPVPRERKTVEDAREYVGAVCPRLPESQTEEDAPELPEDPLSDEECHGARLVLQDAEEEIASAPRLDGQTHKALAAARRHIEKWCPR